MSSRLHKKINISDNELIVEIIRKSLWSWFWSIFLAVILLLLPFFLIYPLFLQGTWGVVGFFSVLTIALLLIYRIYRSYYYTALIITTKRLVDMEQIGIFGNTSTVVLYNKIDDVNYKSFGLLSAIFKIGNIYISFNDNKSSFIELTAISHPSLVVAKILKQREDYFDHHQHLAGREALKLLAKIKRRLGEDKFNSLVVSN